MDSQNYISPQAQTAEWYANNRSQAARSTIDHSTPQATPVKKDTSAIDTALEQLKILTGYSPKEALTVVPSAKTVQPTSGPTSLHAVVATPVKTTVNAVSTGNSALGGPLIAAIQSVGRTYRTTHTIPFADNIAQTPQTVTATPALVNADSPYTGSSWFDTIKQLTAELTSVRTQYNDLARKSADDIAINTQLRADLDDATAQLLSSELQREELTEQLSQVQKERDYFMEDNNRLAERAKNRDIENDRICEYNRKMTRDNQQLSDDRDQLREQLESMQAQTHSSDKSVSEYDEILAQLIDAHETIEAVKDERSTREQNLQIKLNDCANKLARSENKLASTENQLVNMTRTFKKTSDAFYSTERDFAECKKKLITSEDNLKVTNGINDNLRKENSNLGSRNTQLANQNKNLTNELDLNHSDIKNQAAVIKDLQDNITVERIRVSDLQTRYNKLSDAARSYITLNSSEPRKC